ncbi:hypothetical protein [Kocuria massiliensis]|uniref:hypothetical protein n=1 Tax=Kocuria massiliensis TaxID=1926282 RepID=UPI0022B97FAE|nr:hypothetical protein [Kocuria massiliensis]
MMDNLGPYLVTALSAIVVAWIGLRPKKADPDQLLRDDLTRMRAEIKEQSEQIKMLKTASDDQWTVIQELRGKIDSLWTRLRRVIDYARELEAKLVVLTGEPHDRPHEVDEIFEHK